MKNEIIPLIKGILNKAIIEGNKIDVYNIQGSSFRFYSDNCGQRSAYLQIYSYKIPDYIESDLNHGIYNIVRRLSFTNKVDEGKENAILGTLNLNEVRNINIKYEKEELFITLDFVIIAISPHKVNPEYIQKVFVSKKK